MACLDDDDYDVPQIIGRTRTYWHPDRHCYVTAFVGELRSGTSPPQTAALALVKEGRRIEGSELMPRLDDLLKRSGPLRIQTLAELLGCSKYTMRNYISRGGTKYGRERRGRNVLYSLASIPKESPAG